MDCHTTKQLIRRGRAEQAAEHMAACEDCAAFAAEFTGVAALLNQAAHAHTPADDLLARTLAMAQCEMAQNPAYAALAAPAPAVRVSGARLAAAAAAAAALAPALLLGNYLFAEAVRDALGRHLPAMVGALYMAGHISGAVMAMGLGCALLTLIVGAAAGRTANSMDKLANGAA
jgi:hypothetical protein